MTLFSLIWVTSFRPLCHWPPVRQALADAPDCHHLDLPSPHHPPQVSSINRKKKEPRARDPPQRCFRDAPCTILQRRSRHGTVLSVHQQPPERLSIPVKPLSSLRQAKPNRHRPAHLPPHRLARKKRRSRRRVTHRSHLLRPAFYHPSARHAAASPPGPSSELETPSPPAEHHQSAPISKPASPHQPSGQTSPAPSQPPHHAPAPPVHGAPPHVCQLQRWLVSSEVKKERPGVHAMRPVVNRTPARQPSSPFNLQPRQPAHRPGQRGRHRHRAKLKLRIHY